MVNFQKQFKKAPNKLLAITAFLMAFFLPVHLGISNLFLIAFFVLSGYFILIKKEYVFRNPKLLLLSLLPLFLLYCFGLFYSNPPFEGLKIIGRNLSFLLAPLLLFFCSVKNLKYLLGKMYVGITLGSITSICILLTNNFLNYFATRPFLGFDDEIFNYYYTYYSFTNLLDIHPTYLGAYLIFAVSFLLKRLFKGKTNKLLILTAIVILTVGIIFINSRIVFLLYSGVLLSGLLYGAFIFYKRRKFGALFLIIIITVAGVFSIIKVLSNTFIVTRLTSELQWELSDQVDTAYNDKLNADSRIARWQSAIDAIAQKPFFGYGTHSEKDILEGFYEKNGLLVSSKNRYDAHNIYLSIMLEYGIFGLCILLIYLLSNLYLSLKTKNVQYFLLFIMICVIGCFESYLKNNAAITFVAFFGSVYLFSAIPENLKKESL
jgi:O-antigen ligase